MRKLLFLPVLLLCLAGIARAGCDMNPQPMEVGVSYDYVRVNTTFGVPTGGSGGGTTATNTGLNLNGWNAEAAYNPFCILGVVADFSGVYGTPSVAGFPITSHVYSYVFGPRFNWRNSSPVTPFAETLFGGAHASFSNSGLGSLSSNAFEGNFGGGVDINLGGHWALRPKGDYVLTHFGGRTQNNGTVSVAIVFKFGGA